MIIFSERMLQQMNITTKVTDEFALLGDLHLGIKNDDEWTEDNVLSFFAWFCAQCKNRNVRTLLQAGDWFDVRRGVTQRTMEFFREDIYPLLDDTFDDIYVVVGNHDLMLKDFISPNSCREVLGVYDKIHVIEEPTTIEVNGIKVDMIPWICKSNSKSTFKFIKDSTSEYCMGHFELNGYYFYKGLKSSGLQADFLEKYKHVWSGHFHTISNGGNVQYLGTPYTLTLGDANDPRGFWLHSKTTDAIEFIENPITHHHRIYFDADTWEYTTAELDDKFSNKTVKLVIEKSHSDINKKVNIDRVLDELERICHEFKHEYNEAFATNVEGDVNGVVKSDLDIAKEQIDLLDETIDIKDRVNKIFSGLYAEVISL